MLGSNLLNDDLSLIAKANDLCNRLGMDTISAGGVIAFAIEAYEKGFLTIKDTRGLELKWGPSDNILKLIELINFSIRLSKIKSMFSRQVALIEKISTSRKNKRERGLWQRRFWEHLIRDENDYEHHLNYIHYNPLI